MDSGLADDYCGGFNLYIASLLVVNDTASCSGLLGNANTTVKMLLKSTWLLGAINIATAPLVAIPFLGATIVLYRLQVG